MFVLLPMFTLKSMFTFIPMFTLLPMFMLIPILLYYLCLCITNVYISPMFIIMFIIIYAYIITLNVIDNGFNFILELLTSFSLRLLLFFC